ncbi:hypothetical protein TL16_g08909 [Triparma laevis f. inornata]|uniref:EF-hand domain-containing protein n=1 Tax=Triparma laevis f. inornata TaxID=1714386 RepID=A0A9W7ELG0_9STRA|nr:hypothetical protein TL16_g08909 [Triparma laevis f. inornata]
MYVWKSKSRRDRRHFASTGLETLDEADLDTLRKNEVGVRKEEEVNRYELEQIEVDKFVNFAREDITTYFSTRNGMDEVSAVGAVLMDDRAKAEILKKEKMGDDEEEDDDVSVLTTSSLDKHEKKKKKKDKSNDNTNTTLEEPPQTISTEQQPTGTANEEADKKIAADKEKEKADKKLQKEAEKKKMLKSTAGHVPHKKKKGETSSPEKPKDPMSIEFILEMNPSEMNKDQKTKMKIHQVFSMFDADAGGTINREEMRNCVDELCIPMDDDELTQVMKEVDEDDTGEIDFEEFFGWYQKNAGAATKGKAMGSMALKFAKAMRQYNGESVREEAKRLILACAEREAEEKSRHVFRLSRPPRFCCMYCGESFKNAVDEGIHKAKAKMIHKDWDHEREATLKRQHPVLTIFNGPEARKWRVRRLIHSQHLYDPELDGITYDDITVWKNKTRPFNSDPNDKRGDQLRRGQLVEGFDAKVGKRAGFVQRGFVLRDQRPGEGRTRNHMACNPMLLPDIILRLYMDKQPHITKHVKKRARKNNIPLPIDTITNTFLCDPAGGGSKAMVSFHWSGLVYQGAFVMGEFNGYKGERMESQGHVNAAGESEFVLERHLSAGIYHYYFLIDGRKRIDKTKPATLLNGQKRNIVTVCNPSILGGQGGPYNDGRLAGKNFDAVLGAGGDVSTLVENSSVDMVGKISRGNSRIAASRGGSRPGTTNSTLSKNNNNNNNNALALRPSSTEGQHRLNAIMTPSNEGMSPTWLATGGKPLKRIDLVHNMVCDDGSWALGQALVDNHRVHYVDLCSNLITSDGMVHLATMLKGNGTITTLKMSANNIGYDGCRAFSNALIFNDELRLRHLELAQNSLEDDGAEAICRGLKGCGTITFLNLDGNRIHDDGAAAIGVMLAHNMIITTLQLAYNQIEGVGTRAIGQALQKNCTLTNLNLNANPLGPLGLESISNMLRLNDTINTVSMGYSRVLGKGGSGEGTHGLFELCRMLRLNRTLTSLDLAGNGFLEPDVERLLASLFDLDNTQVSTRKRNIAIFELKMEDNSFDGEWLIKDHIVQRNGFHNLPSIPLYCLQNKQLWAQLTEEKRHDHLHWLQMKKIKRKLADQRRMQRRAELDARIAAQKAEKEKFLAIENQDDETSIREAKKEEKRKKKALKRDAAAYRELMREKDPSEMTPEERKRIMSREARLESKFEDENDDMSSLGSFDFIKGGVMLDDELSVVSNLTGAGSMVYRGGKYVFDETAGMGMGEEGESFLGGDIGSVTEGSVKSSMPFGKMDPDSGSYEAPSIDSDFLASMRSSLFGSSVGTPNEEKKEERGGGGKKGYPRHSGMYSVGSQSMQDSISTYVSMASDDSDSIISSQATATTVSMSKNSAASYLVNKAVEDERRMMIDDDSRSDANSVKFSLIGGKPPLPPGGGGGGILNLLGSPSKAKKPKKIYAREEGEWRKDRSWISQRALDRTARKIAEEAARQEQIKRQQDEDDFIGARTDVKQEEMERYFKKDDGSAMVQAVVDELKDLRKDENERKEQELHAIKRKDLVEKTNFFPEAKLRVETRKVFDIFDGDASGQIGVDEFGDLMKELCLPMSKKELKALVKKLDDDGSGELDFEEFFVWYRDNHKEQKQGSVVEQMRLKATSFINASLGSTGKMEAKRILISNETKDIVALARHDFRTSKTGKPQFECMECHAAFIDKKSKKLHDKNVEEIHAQHALLHARATARHKLVDMARFRVTKGEAYPKFFVYPDDVPDHVELQVMDRPDLEVGRPLGVINKNTTVKALMRSGEKGTGDWIKIVYNNFEEAWVAEKTRRPLKIHLVPMGVGEDRGEEEEEEEYEEEEEVLNEMTGETTKVKVKKKRKKKKKEEKEVKVPTWPKKGHLEFFAVPGFYKISPKLGNGLELNVRAQPDIDSPIVGFVIPTMAVKCLAMYGDWIQVRFKTYDNAWMLVRNQVHTLMVPCDRDISERALQSKTSPWDWTYDYILDKPTESHTTAGSRDALGTQAFEKAKEEKKSTSTKAKLGLTDQLTDDM